nr:site-2 protease family protein [Candidatus Omnitrophota bacterium]
WLIAILNMAIILNLVLAVFNIMPIPPLDGSRILMGLLPREMAMQYAKIERYGFIIIFGLLWFGAIGAVIWPIVMYLARLLGVTV